MLVFLTSAITSTLRAQVRCGWYDIWLHFILVYVKIAIRPCQNKIIAESNRCASHGMPTLISAMAPTTDYWLTWNNSTGMPGQTFILIKSQYHNRDRTSDRKLESQKFILDSCTNFTLRLCLARAFNFHFENICNDEATHYEHLWCHSAVLLG